MKIAYFKNMIKLANFIQHNDVVAVFSHNNYICVVYRGSDND